MSDEDFDDWGHDPEDDDDGTPDYWACYCCGTSTAQRQMGNMCPTCGAYMEEEYF